ncbi:MAG: hypothetical protein COB38_07715 [Gammaproteobacteria bacterium]|nr:MAG: hypothetical protein COB38_07715 [Gammaproteobacteria bacterium]
MKQVLTKKRSKKLWLSLYFYQLPLEIFTLETFTLDKHLNKDVDELKSPFVVIEKSKLLYCNQTAQACGLTNNMKVATAYALCADLKIKERNPSLESVCLLELANIAYEFSSQVCLYNNKTILLEVSGSCRLFSDLTNLLKQLNNKISLIAVSFYVAIAETPKQAFLLSIYDQESLTQVTQKAVQENNHRLDKIPIDFIAQDSFTQTQTQTHKQDNLKKITLKIKRMGIKILGDLFKLPDATLGRRFGSQFLTYLYRLKGQAEDPLTLYSIADYFSVQRCFLSGLDTIEQILFPAKPMLESLVCFLSSRRKMASKITWRFECFNGEQLSIDILLSSQVQSTQQLMGLTRLKLQQIHIKEKIEMVFLQASNFLCKNEKQNTLELTSLSKVEPNHLNDNAKEALDYLKDKIDARLKKENYFKLFIHDEYLPEKRSTLQFIQEHKTNLTSPCTQTYSHKENNHDKIKQQPLWLLSKMEKINLYSNNRHSNNSPSNKLPSNNLPSNNLIQQLNYKGLLTIESTAEKIENHWWYEDHYTHQSHKSNRVKNTCRDYFIAKNKQGICYWIFFDQYQEQWFVHGIF